MYQIRMYYTCRCTINSTAVSLFVCSLVGGGTHDTYIPPKKQLYRYLFIRYWVVVRMILTFRPWTHTSDDSYIYQLSLVVATATVSSYIHRMFKISLRRRVLGDKKAIKKLSHVQV